LPAFRESERFPQCSRIAWIRKRLIGIVYDEIEKGFQEGIFEAFGGLFLAF